jgi:hypothetical protein
MVSFISSRRGYPSWWTEEDRTAADKVKTEGLPAYYKAKVAADEHLAALAKKRGEAFQAINLRPGTLKDEPATGKVLLGMTPLMHSTYCGYANEFNQAKRQAVVRLLAKMLRGWLLHCLSETMCKGGGICYKARRTSRRLLIDSLRRVGMPCLMARIWTGSTLLLNSVHSPRSAYAARTPRK